MEARFVDVFFHFFWGLRYLCARKMKQKSMQRYFIYLAYDGTAYHGWQIQPNGDSVQECLMRALATLMRREVEVIGAGRTDAGVGGSVVS